MFASACRGLLTEIPAGGFGVSAATTPLFTSCEVRKPTVEPLPNVPLLLRARDGEGAKSCGSDRSDVVSAGTPSSESSARLLQAETAG